MKNEKLASFIKILLIIMIILSLVLFIYTIVFISIISSKVKKREINRIEDINISCFKSFNFIDDSTKPQYNPDTENLGLTGRLYLNCTSGRCRKVETVETFEEECDIDDDCYYYSVYKNYTIFNIKYNCSLECYNSDIIYCSSCPSDYDKHGLCLRYEADEYGRGTEPRDLVGDLRRGYQGQPGRLRDPLSFQRMSRDHRRLGAERFCAVTGFYHQNVVGTR